MLLFSKQMLNFMGGSQTCAFLMKNNKKSKRIKFTEICLGIYCSDGLVGIGLGKSLLILIFSFSPYFITNHSLSNQPYLLPLLFFRQEVYTFTEN